MMIGVVAYQDGGPDEVLLGQAESFMSQPPRKHKVGFTVHYALEDLSGGVNQAFRLILLS